MSSSGGGAERDTQGLRGPTPADTASTWALAWSVASIFVAGIVVWLALPFGLPALCIGFAGWVISVPWRTPAKFECEPSVTTPSRTRMAS